MFLPTTRKELIERGIEDLDVVIVTGDAYIDSPYDGAAVIGKVLEKAGYKVGIISQPDMNSNDDITRLGEPKLFWGVTAGAVDSMVANYTALKKKKRNDDSTPGGVNDRRPDRAVMKYVNLIQRYYKNTAPIVIGGVEASLRRIAHYDYWDDKVRRPIIFDAKADVCVYSMGEKTILDLAKRFEDKRDYTDLRGLCYISKTPVEEYIQLPSFEEASVDKIRFIEMFKDFYANNDPMNALGLCQKVGDRYLIQNPPNYYTEGEELDALFEMNYEYDAHPFYKNQGEIRALETIKFSITSHVGCFGECNFCAITVHQGRKIRSRSEESIIREAKRLTKLKRFTGNIYDVGGATANMYGMECKKMIAKGACKDKRCAFPQACKAMNIDHSKHLELIKKVKQIEGLKKLFVGSGIRYDLILQDEKAGAKYMRYIVENCVSGQMKIAPEHATDKVLDAMGKPSGRYLKKFRDEFYKISQQAGKNQFLTYYFIAAHPGCEYKDMVDLNGFIKKELKLNPEQVQIFTPTPATWASTAYYTGLDPNTLKPIYVEKKESEKRRQKEVIVGDNLKFRK